MKKTLAIAFLLFCAAAADAQTLIIMSYNIHHGADATDTDQLDNMARFIKASGADMVGLQEVDSVCRRSGNTDQLKRLAELTGMHYAFARHMAYDGGAYGQGILSKYPISGVRNNRLTLLTKSGKKDSRALLSAVIHLPEGKKVVLASAHFALDSVSRLIQARETIAFLANDSIPVILTGDLNSLPGNRDVQLLKTYFAVTDPAGRFTFPVDRPAKMIDYIFITGKFPHRVADHTVLNNIRWSDHLPVVATVVIGE